MPAADGGGHWQLYDLEADRGKVHDLSARYPDKLAELLVLWREYVEENGVIEAPVSVFDADAAAFEAGWSAYRNPPAGS